ncbi:hypothetical protein [Streptomyces sp. bgisy100]|uniref:hypothetical protein n=1 Tax=Streptomyces sp. bgisy100 TaxID=3413783 RepID=UPI003D728107
MHSYDVTLLHTNWPEKNPDYFAPLRDDPPHGFTYSDQTWECYPGITGRRAARSQFHAIAEVAAEAARSGVLLNDAGVEKTGEWLGHDENQQVVAHLLLMAAHRAAYCGLDVQDLTDLLHAVSPAVGRAGPDGDPA